MSKIDSLNLPVNVFDYMDRFKYERNLLLNTLLMIKYIYSIIS